MPSGRRKYSEAIFGMLRLGEQNHQVNSSVIRKDGGAGGIRTLDTALQPYNGLANRRLQPLGHSSIQNFETALPAEDRHHAGREGRPFALDHSQAQGGLL